jgi:energy-coupling factor transporter ATP-binding protein EcfA2
MNYKEPEYHKEGDSPFTFPPKDIVPYINSNLVEIEGKNGSGKTTLLNCLALSLGYLDQEKELGNKPALKKKLEDLDANKSLEYDFRVCCKKPEVVDLRIQRVAGQRPKFWFNSNQVASEDILKRFEVIFSNRG